MRKRMNEKNEGVNEFIAIERREKIEEGFSKELCLSRVLRDNSLPK